MILKDSAMTVAGLEVESNSDDVLLDASSPDVRNENSDSSFYSSRITDLSTSSVSTTGGVPTLTQDAKYAATDVSLLSRGVVAVSVISQTEAAVSQIRVSDPSSLTFAVKNSKIISILTPTQDTFSRRASSVTSDVRTDSKITSLKSNPATTSAPWLTTTAADVHTTLLSHAVEIGKIDSTSSEVDFSTVTELSRTSKPKPSSSQSSTDVAIVTYSLSSSTSLDVTEVSSSATSLLGPDGVAMQSQSTSLVSHFDGHDDTTSQNILISILRTNTLAVSTTDSFTTSPSVQTDFPTTSMTLVKSSSSQSSSVSTGQTTQPIIDTSTASDKLTTDSRTSSQRPKKEVTSVHISSTERQEAESTVIPKTNFPFYYDSQSLHLDLSRITSDNSSNNHVTSILKNFIPV